MNCNWYPRRLGYRYRSCATGNPQVRILAYPIITRSSKGAALSNSVKQCKNLQRYGLKWKSQASTTKRFKVKDSFHIFISFESFSFHNFHSRMRFRWRHQKVVKRSKLLLEKKRKKISKENEGRWRVTVSGQGTHKTRYFEKVCKIKHWIFYTLFLKQVFFAAHWTLFASIPLVNVQLSVRGIFIQAQIFLL